jgi:hypothetical protein
MSFQPLKIAPVIEDFINARLQEKNREKRGDEYLQKACRSYERVQVLHGAIVTSPSSQPIAHLFLSERKYYEGNQER